MTGMPNFAAWPKDALEQYAVEAHTLLERQQEALMAAGRELKDARETYVNSLLQVKGDIDDWK